MSDLSELILGEQRGRFRNPAPAVSGVVATTLGAPDDDLYVVVPEYDPHLRFGPCPFVGPLPVRGDDCLVIFDDERQPWVVIPGAIEEGGGGGTGDDKNYVHTQGSPSTVWSVTHNLGKFPAVDVVDTGDSVVIPTVHYDSTNAVTLTFGSATSGKAYFN